MISKEMRQAFADYAEKRTSFDRFARTTQDFWTAAAKYLLARWKAPEAVEPKDLVQELLLEAWESFPKYDPARGDLADYVSYQAISRAKRWLHGQRGRRKCSRSDKAPSRNMLRFCDLTRFSSNADADAEVMEFLETRLGAFEPEQERHEELGVIVNDTIRMVQEILRRPHDRSEAPFLRAYVEADGNILQALEILQGQLPQTKDLEAQLLKSLARAIERRRFERTLPDATAPETSSHPLSDTERKLLMEI